MGLIVKKTIVDITLIILKLVSNLVKMWFGNHSSLTLFLFIPYIYHSKGIIFFQSHTHKN